MLCHELTLRNLAVERQKPLPIIYKDVQLDVGYRIDLVIENRLIVELKTVDALQPVHEAQLLTYLKLSGIGTGLLFNFHSPVLRDSMKRLVLNKK
ncbi:MAG: GxxExxY protein [Phycisphaeraceae bacterium]